MSEPAWRKSSRSNPNGGCLEWRTSSRSSGGTCVEVAGDFVKSSFSLANGNCVEGAPCACGGALVRDSKDPDGPVLSFSGDEWTKFLSRLKRGPGNAEPGSAG